MMETSGRPSVTQTQTINPDAPLFEDQVREYRRGQRRRYNAQRNLRNLARTITGRNPYQMTLEEQVDPDTQLRRSLRDRAAIVPAEVLYNSRRDDNNHRVYNHLSEEAILCTDNQQIDRPFIQPESYAALRQSGMQFIHIGVAQVRIQILHRQDEGTSALVVFRDNRWQGDQSIFDTVEIDLTKGSQLVYVIPDTMQTIGDFYRNFQISILTRGYQNWQNGEANLLITRGLVGRLSNTSNVGFAYQISNVSEYLVSRGIRALSGRRYSAQENQGRNWVVRPSRVEIPMMPTELQTSNLLDGRISISFQNYVPAPNHASDIPDDDEDEVRSETILILTKEESDIEETDNDEEDDWQYIQYLADQSAQPPDNSQQKDSGPVWDTDKEGDDGNTNKDWINPFSERGGETMDTIFMMNDNNTEETFDYPQFKNLSNALNEHAFMSSSSAISHYQPPQDQSMNMPSYPPARSTNEARPIPTFEERVPRAGRFRGATTMKCGHYHQRNNNKAPCL